MITILQLASLYILTSVIFVYFLFELAEIKAKRDEKEMNKSNFKQLSYKKKIPVVPIKGLLEHKETASDYEDFQKIKAVRAARLIEK